VTKSDGKCKIDGVEVGELTFVGIGSPTPVLSVKYAYVFAETGDRMGYSNRNLGWSERTLSLLNDLLLSVEEDVAREVFDLSTTTGGVLASTDPTTDSIPSL
jgi:hypothetical protein